MKRVTILGSVILAAFWLPPRSHAGTDSDSIHASYLQVVESDFTTAFSDAGLIFGAPLHFDATHWIGTASILGGTSAIFPADNDVRSFFSRNHSRLGDDLAGVGQRYGNTFYAVGFSGLVYAGGLLLEKPDVRETGLMLVESLAFAGLTTTVIKAIAGRSRPYLEEGPYRYHGPGTTFDHSSLPSGHATVAFSISSVISARVHNTWASVALYSLAALTAASRVYDDEHWLSDSFLGAAIGTVFGLAVSDAHEHRGDGASLRLSPSSSGLRIVYIF